MMTRKDSEKDAERPHYYSQFWLDVAAGRRIIGTPKPGEEGDLIEPEVLETVIPRRPVRSNHLASTDGHLEEVHEPEAEVDVEPEVEDEELEEVDQVDEQDLPNIVVEEDELPDIDAEEDLDEDEEDEDEEDLGEDEEDEDEETWPSGRGRKKPKPTRPVKPVKRPKRDPRRGGF